MEKVTQEDYLKVINNNLSRLLFFSNYAGKYMIKQRSGIIINISSVLSKFPLIGRSLYSISKAGIDSLTRSIALEWEQI